MSRTGQRVGPVVGQLLSSVTSYIFGYEEEMEIRRKL
jgi:hypothetical protein